jgi:pentatricopeptide repeat domain-containing protein 1
VVPRVDKYTCAVRACTANGKWQTALRVFDSAASLLPAGDGSADDSGAGGAAAGRGNSGWQLRGLWAAAVEACGEGGQWEKATELLARMDRAFLGGAAQPGAAELTTAPTNGGGGGSGGGLDGFGGRLGGSESDEGQGEQLRERRRPPRFEGRAFAHAIKACERAGQWRRAVELLNKGRANGVLEYFGPASASSGFSSSGASSSSRSEVSDGDEDEDGDALPPVLPYNMVLAALGRSGQWREALALLDELEAAADARAREKERRDAAQEALLAAVSASVSGAAAAGASGGEAAAEGEAPLVPAFQRPRPPAARLPLPDLVSYNSCVAACGRAGEWAAALRVLSRLKPRGVQPDKVLPRTQASGTFQ